MMPLTFASVGEENMIRKVGGNSEIRAHLENLGFVTGGNVTVVSTIGGNLIVNVKDSRVAISREMASKILGIIASNKCLKHWKGRGILA